MVSLSDGFVKCLVDAARVCTGRGVAEIAFGGGLDYSVLMGFNDASLAECCRVAGLDAADELQT